jgi:LPXTG-motif cell wall-anchored protein
MTSTPRRTAQVGVAILALLAILFASAAPVRAVEPGTTASPALAAADWLATELEAKDGILTVSFGGPEFADQGLTIDAVLAILAAGAEDDPAVDVALDALAADLAIDTVDAEYLTGFETLTDRAANAVAKTLLLETISGVDVSPGTDLDADLRSLMETDGDDLGRFSDTDSKSYGNYANGIGQALGILALDRTGGGVPSDAVDYLLQQQCSDGGFRLYQFGYTLSFDPFEQVETHTCEDPAEGDPDATAFALMALLEAPSSPAVSGAIDDAVDHLLAQQQASGGFFGTGAVNSNTTGLAATALRAAGEDEAADAGAAFLAALQSDACEEYGALAYDRSAFDAGIDADRGQWTRATAQGALGLGVPAYGGIGTVAPVDLGLDDVSCPAAPPVPTVPVVPKVTASASTVAAGGDVTLTGVGFLPGETVDITLHSALIHLGTTTAGADGTAIKTVTIPMTLEPGLHTIEMEGQTSGVTVTTQIEVTEAPGTSAVPLPATGSATGELAALGVGLVALGAASVVASRRRLAASVS